MIRSRYILPVAACLLTLVACSGSPGTAAAPPSNAIAQASAVPTPSLPATPTSQPTRPPTPSPGPTPQLLASTFTPGGTATEDSLEVVLGSCCYLIYEPYKLTAKAGRVELFLSSFDGGRPLRHDMLIGTELGKPLVQSPSLDQGEAGLWVIDDLPAADYVFWCSVSSHYLYGMTGTLTVTP